MFLLFPFQSIIPDFHSWEIEGEGNTEEESQNTEIEHKQNASTPPETLQGGIKEYNHLVIPTSHLAISDEEFNEYSSNKCPVLPTVNYEWVDIAPSKPPLYVKHLKR